MSMRKMQAVAGTLDQAMLNELSRYGDILMPHDADEPILAPGPRAALFEWLKELSLAEELEKARLKPRRTALLFGPPGTGKTTFSHHFAARLGLPLICVRSESLVDSLLGSTGKNIGHLFSAMDRCAGKVVMFFDEIDAIGGKRMHDQGASVERANSLNVMLRRIERFEGICLGATNRKDFLDSALWRRFHMQVSIDLPGPDERFAIIQRYAAPYRLSEADADLLTDLTHGASPALLRGLMEGVKRAIVLWPRINRSLDNPVAVYEAVVASVTPPPEFDEHKPPLWSGQTKALSRLEWPMALA